MKSVKLYAIYGTGLVLGLLTFGYTAFAPEESATTGLVLASPETANTERFEDIRRNLFYFALASGCIPDDVHKAQGSVYPLRAGSRCRLMHSNGARLGPRIPVRDTGFLDRDGHPSGAVLFELLRAQVCQNRTNR
jgi:hypothetical protein